MASEVPLMYGIVAEVVTLGGCVHIHTYVFGATYIYVLPYLYIEACLDLLGPKFFCMCIPASVF